MNSISLSGRLTADPDIRKVGEYKVASFTLAVPRSYAPKGKDRETDFITCEAWRGGAKLLEQYVEKGDKIAVTGELQQQHWEDKDGNPRYTYRVIVSQVDIIGTRTTREQPVDDYDETEDAEYEDDFEDIEDAEYEDDFEDIEDEEYEDEEPERPAKPAKKPAKPAKKPAKPAKKPVKPAKASAKSFRTENRKRR